MNRRGVLRQVVCRKRDRMLLIPPEQILWFQVEDGIVKAHTADDTFWVNSQLSELEAGLPAELFFRARREVLVNVPRIKEIRPYFKSGFLLHHGGRRGHGDRGERTPGAPVPAADSGAVARRQPRSPREIPRPSSPLRARIVSIEAPGCARPTVDS